MRPPTLKMLSRFATLAGALVFLSSAVGPTRLWAAACNATASGNWSSVGTWSGCSGPGGVPASIDTITINSGVTVTLDIDATVAALTFAVSAGDGGLTHNGTTILIVNGPVVINQPSSNNVETIWSINAGSATVTGLVHLAGTTNSQNRDGRIVITTGELNAWGGLRLAVSHNNSKIIDMTGGAGRLNLKGELDAPANSGTLDAGTAGSIFNYCDHAAGQTVRIFSAGAYNHLYFNNTSTGAILSSAISATNVTGNLRIESGLLTNGGFGVVGGTGDAFEVRPNATFQMTGTSAFPSGYSTFQLDAASTIQYRQSTTPLTLAALTYGSLELSAALPNTRNFPAGDFRINGHLVMGDGVNTTSVNANAADTTLTVRGDVIIHPAATFIPHGTNPLTVGGNWSTSGSFTNGTSTLIFASTGPQSINHKGRNFTNLISSNTSAAGLTFLSSFTAAQFTVRTGDLNSAATIYFAGNTTATITGLQMSGTPAFPLVLKSTQTGTRWFVNNLSTNAVNNVAVQDSEATGLRILNYPGGLNLGNNRRWAVGINPPAPTFAAASETSLEITWIAPDPEADTYDIQVATSGDFNGTVTTSNTATTSVLLQSLSVNTTYHARARSIINGSVSALSAPISTATLANAPTLGDWSTVHYTSAAVTWNENGNPLGTRYSLEVSTVDTFSAGQALSSTTTGFSATITALASDTTYYARVRAFNHSGAPSDFLVLASTKTTPLTPPQNPAFTNATPASISVGWTAPLPAPDSYTLELNTEIDFTGTPASSTTAVSSATFNGLLPNTTYHVRINAVLFGSSSAWTNVISTSTWSRTPATAASTWSAVFQSSLTVTWLANGNPDNTSRYVVELSTVSGFGSGDVVSSGTYLTNASFRNLNPGTNYFSRVKAVNHQDVHTSYTALGSTQTRASASCNATTTGNWSAGGTWTNCTGVGGLPSTTDIVTINSGVTVTLDQDATVERLIFASATVNNGLTHGAGRRLTVGNIVTLNQPAVDGVTSLWAINSGTATVEGLITFAGTNTSTVRISRVVITSGQLDANGGLTFVGSSAASKVINMSGGAGRLNIKRNLTVPGVSSTLTAGTAGSIVNFAGDSTGQTVRFFSAGAYHNLYLNNTSTGATLAAAVTAANVTGSIRVQSGLFSNGGFAIAGNAGRTFEVNDPGSFTMTGTAAFPTAFSSYVFTAGSTVRYMQATTPLTISTQPFGNLELVTAVTNTRNFPAGNVFINGNLLIGNGVNISSVNANNAATVLRVGGSVTISPAATFIANGANTMSVGGNWSTSGNFTAGTSSIAFSGAGAQVIDHKGRSFAGLISSNTSTSGVTFLSSFTANNFYVNAPGLGTSATVYFASLATATINSLNLTGSPASPVVLRSAADGTEWGLNNTGINRVSYVAVKDSNASGGRRILNYPGGVDLGGNLNWAIGLNPPATLSISSATTTRLTGSWAAADPAGDTYTLQVSANPEFSSVSEINTAALSANTPATLSPNTTYYARVDAIINATSSTWSTSATTATLANQPLTAVSTWTAVHLTSATVSWNANGNPANVTTFQIQLSTVNGFDSGTLLSSFTVVPSVVFNDLETDTTYYARVQAINHSGVETNFTSLGSTVTVRPKSCNATASGNWNAGGTWTGCTGVGGIPGETDLVTINAGVTVTLNVDATVASLTFATSAANGGLTHAGAETLIVNGPVLMNQPTSNNTNIIWALNAGSATVKELIHVSGAQGSASRDGRIVITSGELNALGGILFMAGNTGAKVIDMSGGAGRINLKGELTVPPNSATLTAGSQSIINFADHAAGQTIRSFPSGAYNHLYVNNTSTGAVLSEDLSATGNLHIQSGLLNTGGFNIVGGTGDTFEIGAGGILEMSETSAFPSGYTSFLFDPASTVRYLQTSTPLTVAAQRYGTLELISPVPNTRNFPAGDVFVDGDLLLGNGNAATTVSADAASTALTVGGDVVISAAATFVANNANPMTVVGNWTTFGNFTAGASTVSLASADAQIIDHRGQSFSHLISSNTSASGLTFVSSFTASQFSIRTADLNSPATVFFMAGTTTTIANIAWNGTAALPLVLRSSNPGSPWFLNNLATAAVNHVAVQDSDASGGARILAYPGGQNLGGNSNWVFAVNAPDGLSFTTAAASGLTGEWNVSDPYGDVYAIEIGTASDFSGTRLTSTTAFTSAAFASLSVNTTYYGRVQTLIYGAGSLFSSFVATATLANTPASEAWTSVQFTSVTVAWSDNSNPLNQTRYDVDLSTVSDFGSGLILSSDTVGLNATFVSLIPDSTYYARIKAVNHSGIPTNFAVLPSTKTSFVPIPGNLSITSVDALSVTGGWTGTSPAPTGYMFNLSTESDFTGTSITSNTALTSATTTGLTPNTTYFARVSAVMGGSTGSWTTSVTTATLAATPASTVSTWTAVYTTSLTVTWSNNGNPLNTTRYRVDLSTVSAFNAGDVYSSATYATAATFEGLEADSTFYARVLAVAHSGTQTPFTLLGSTKTVGSTVPKNFDFSGVGSSSATATWTAPSAPVDTYTLQVGDVEDFSGTNISSTTRYLMATTLTLIPNTTYYGRVLSTTGGVSSPWTATQTTATLAAAPAPTSSTWSVHTTSLTVNWDRNSNPLDVTRYTVHLSTVSGFGSGTTLSSVTYAQNARFESLLPNSTYYARASAMGHGGTSTPFTVLGSTLTGKPPAPFNLDAVAASTSSLTAVWDAPTPPGNTYVLQAATSSNFGGTVFSSSTVISSATTPHALAVNTTYYLRVNAVIGPGLSSFTSSVATATLARAPAVATTTWNSVFQSSLTVTWTANGNPSNVSSYQVDLSTVSGFGSGDLISSTTVRVSANFTDLEPGGTYYARVKTMNHSQIGTAYTVLGSTTMRASNTCNATADGNWSSGGTWTNCTGAGGIPAETDVIVINAGVDVSLNTNATVGGLTFALGTSSNSLTHIGTAVLTVNGPVIINQPTSNSRTNTWNINAGSASVKGLLSFAGTSNTVSRLARIVLTSGELNALNGMTFAGTSAGTKEIVMSAGPARINLKGSLTMAGDSATLTAGTAGSVFNYAGTDNPQTVRLFPAGAYHHLYLNNTSTGATLSAALTAINVTGDLRVQSGLFSNGGFGIAGNATRTFGVLNDGIFKMTGPTAFPSGFGTVTVGTNSTVQYEQTTTPLTVTALNYGRLELIPSASATQHLPVGSFNVAGHLLIGNGFHSTTVNANTNNTTLVVGGSVTIAGAATFIANNTNATTVGGSWSNDGTFTAGTSTVTFNGSGVQNLRGSTTFYNFRALTTGATLQFTPNTTYYVTNRVNISNVSMRSATPGDPWYFTFSGSSYSFSSVDVQDSNASGGQFLQAYGLNSGNNTHWDFGAPFALTSLFGTQGSLGRSLNLTWTAPGDDGLRETLNNSTYTIQYTTDTSFALSNNWSPTAAQPNYVSRISIATTSVTPGSLQGRVLTGLVAGNTYYVRLWTKDDVGITSNLSNGATTYATNVVLSVNRSTDTLQFGSLAPGTTNVYNSSITFTNDGNVTARYNISVINPTTWAATNQGAGVDTFRLTGLFNDTIPAIPDFDISNDVITTTPVAASSTAFGRDAGPNLEKGFDVEPGASRTLWFRIEMPPVSSTADEQTIRVQAEASE